MSKFEGILICTDLDGTLLKNDKTISPENIRAIEYFQREGGLFTFVTGRMPFFVSHIWNAIKPNAPFGCINGGGLYDYEKQAYIQTSVLPREALSLVECVEKSLPEVGIQVNTFHKVYFSRENETMEIFRRITGVPNLVRHYGEVEEPMAKIVFGSEDDGEVMKVEQILRAHPLAEQFDFIRSERTLFEILPKGVGKGSAIRNLAEHLHLDISQTVAIGDYDNDISMLRAAGIGIAVANASPGTLAAADAVTVTNEENAISKVIFGIENGKFKRPCS